MRCAVVLGADSYEAGSNNDGVLKPRLEFTEIACVLDADILSYASASERLGGSFRILFDRNKKAGSILNGLMLARRYDRIYVTTEGVGLPLALLLKAFGWRGKIACVFHNMSYPGKVRFLSLLGHDIFCGLITVNNLQSEILIEQCRAPARKVLSVFNWVDTDFFRPGAAPTKVETPVVMACGAENRDYETLARAANLVSERIEVYGHGFLASNVQASTSAPNLTYMPRVSYLQLREAYAACAVVVVPLRDVTFAAGVTGLVEAMAAGRPLIATASRGVKDYLYGLDPETIVPPDDHEAMAAAITRVSGDAQKRKLLGERNRTFALDNCSVKSYARRIAQVMLAP